MLTKEVFPAQQLFFGLSKFKRGTMKKYLSIPLMLLAWLLAIPAWAIAETDPDTLVDNTAQEVLAIVRQDKDIQGGNKAKILDLVEAKILPHFDFTRMTRLAMGKNWSKATPEQQQELVKEFRTLAGAHVFQCAVQLQRCDYQG